MIYSKIKKAQRQARINLKNTLKKDSNEALLLKVEAQSLTTLMGELENKSTSKGQKEVADDLVISTLKKFIKDLKFTIQQNEKNDLTKIATDPFKIELNLLNKILIENGPQQMSEGELSSLIHSIVKNGAGNMGAVMGALKKDYNGCYDGTSAAKIAKGLFS
jgi:uncharacterized protein YqeY